MSINQRFKQKKYHFGCGQRNGGARKFRTLPFLLLLFLLSITNPARATDFSDSHGLIFKYKSDIEEMIAGTSDLKKRFQKDRCRHVETDYLATELGKVKFNDLFHEIQSEEQIEDIKALAAELKKTENCRKRFILWNDYDNKWYAAERNRKAAEKEAQQKEWEKLVQDTGPEYLDAVIEGTAFQIPRKYIWFQRNKSDGIPTGVNLLFNYPGLTVKRDPDSPYGDRTEIEGVLMKGGGIRTLPCEGFEDREECTLWRYQTGFTTDHLNCGEYDPEHPWKRHWAVWRRACKSLRVGFDDDVTPIFDEDLQMWNLNGWAFYSGSPEFPDYWFQCETQKFPKDMPLEEVKRGRCNSAFQVNEEVFFKYSFPARLFWEHEHIHKTLKEKIEDFIVKEDQGGVRNG